MATFFPCGNSEDSINAPSKLKGVSSTVLLSEQQEKEENYIEEVEEKVEEKEKDKEKEEGQEKDQTESAKQKALRFLSKLVLLAMVPVLWCSICDLPALVWRFSFLLCCGSIVWSRRLDDIVSVFIMLIVTFSGFMTALYLDAALDQEITVLMAHLNSHLAAGMLGYALAKHCQHNGLEVTPATVTPPQKLTEKQQENVIHSLILAWCYIGTITVLCAARMAWVVWYRAEYPMEYLALHAFGPMSFALVMWSIFLGVLLRGVFIGQTRLGVVGGMLVSVQLLLIMSWLVFGDIGAMLVTWVGILIWTGWFGYSLCVYNSFKHEPLLQPVCWFPPQLLPPLNALKSSSSTEAT